MVPEGQRGNEIQCEGVAQVLGLTPHVKYVSPPAREEWLTYGFLHFLGPYAPPFLPSGVGPPWPDIVLASGGRVVPVARAIKRESRGRCFLSFFQNPVVSPKKFDFVWAPLHDRVAGDNVFTTLLSPHPLTPKILATEAAVWIGRFSALPRPWIAVLVGGANAAYAFSPRDVSTLCDGLRMELHKRGGSLLVVGSRRTGEQRLAQMRRELKGVSAFIWDFVEPNPYKGVLGLADFVVVSADSVNMVGEALLTRAPVYIFIPEGKSGKFAHFLAELFRHDMARPFKTVLTPWQREPVNDTLRIAQALQKAFGKAFGKAWQEKGRV